MDIIDGIGQAFNNLIGNFELILDFFANAFKAVIFSIRTSIQALPVVLKVTSVMPWVILAGVITTIVIFVLRAIFGR